MGGLIVDTVLIVDDSSMLLNYLENAFAKYRDRFRVNFAADGMEAIDIIKSREIALLVTDLQMPRIDGLGLLAYVQKYHPGIPCIVMSAHGTPAIVENLQSDILQFIEKPFTADALAGAILSALEKDQAGGSITGISIGNFLQMIELEQKTCLCEVASAGNPKGFFYFSGGELHHAVYGDLKGEEAAIKMIQIDRPTISFRKIPQRPIPRKINRELTGLLLEAMKQKDEAR
ncbi:MAG: response regulator [Desulfobulbaceae bacterium]|jgi:CheY-like chemotaxis protein|nr:response regulator [Desulfobulbaceae bacterium]MDY0350578.1 response regulator [Desulfobulbaceae bacterium]